MKAKQLFLMSLFITSVLPLGAQGLSPLDLNKLQEINAEDESSTLDLVQKGPQRTLLLKTADLGSKFITLPDKSRLSLKTAIDDIQNLQKPFTREIQQTMTKNPKAIMNLKALTMVLETPDSYIVVEGNSVEVEDPQAFSQTSGEFRSFMQKRQAKPMTYQKLSAEDQAKVKKYFEKIRAKNSPLSGINLNSLTTLKSGAAQDAPLFDSMMRGQGVFEISETVTLPKISTTQPPQETEVSEASQDKEEPTPDLPATVIRASGKKTFEKTYITGFTYNLATRWEKRWRFPGGLFRMSFEAGFTAGLRLPFKVKVVAEPTKIEVIKNQDISFPVSAQVNVIPFDGDPALFRTMGIRDAVAEASGKEFALAGSINLGYKFYFLGEDWVHRVMSPIATMNYSFDFTPPLNQEWSRRFPIPMDITKTGIDKKWFTGGLELGVKLSATGTVKIDGRWKMQGLNTSFKTMEFTESTEKPLDGFLPRFGDDKTPMGTTISKNYRLEFEKPRYTLQGYATPCARIVAGIDLSIFSGSFETSWRDLNDFRVPLGSITLGRHKGTPDRQSEEIGIKTFSRENTMTPSVAGKVFLTVRTAQGVKDVSFNSKSSDVNKPIELESQDQVKSYFMVNYTDARMASALDNQKRFIVIQSEATAAHIRAVPCWGSAV